MTGVESVADLARALAWVDRQVTHGPLPVAVFGAVDSQGIQALESFGDAHVDDSFALFSITKPLVGLATMRVVERGGLSLRAPLADAVPGFGAGRTDTVRLEHLLSHTAGIGDPALDDARPLAESLLAGRQEFAAGSRVQYSNIAFHGVAELLERATGRDVWAHVDSLGDAAGGHPLGFDATMSRHDVVGGETFGFDMRRMLPHRHPAAGAFGSAAALLSLASGLLTTMRTGASSVVRAATLREMLVPRTVGLPDPVPTDPRKDYGLAWHLRDASSGLLERRVFGHAGLSGTQWWIYPEQDLAFVLLTNLIDPSRYGVDFDELNDAVVTGSE
jgi:CubicO group peptidase (beta-lactamase class C family)